jgi:type VI secretion system secreted protein VgrG
MEHEGIFYFFEFEEKKHTLVITDDFKHPGINPPGTPPDVQFAPNAGPGETGRFLTTWNRSHLVVPGRYTARDFHFAMPRKTLEASEASMLGDGRTYGEVYDFPGDYTEQFVEKSGFGNVEKERDRRVRDRIEEEETPHQVFSGSSYSRDFQVGRIFHLSGHRTLGGNFIPTSIQHSITQSPSHFTGQAVEFPYSNLITCVPDTTHYRPARVSLRPVMQGPQTAIVVDSKGKDDSESSEEIATDEFGRIKIRFHWERKDRPGSFVRVAQVWAGRGWGFQFLPRVGHEVIVDFVEGDPNRPIIIGSFYNGVNPPPFDVPANQTQSGIKTRSSPGGGAQNFNMIRFEDKKDKEEINIHAERNLTTIVEADESRNVGHDRSTTIKNDETIVITDGNRTETLEKGNESVTLKLGNRKVVLEKGNDELTIQLGNHTTSVPVGTDKVTALNIELSATASITLRCGASQIKMDPATITIVAPMVKINS